MKAARPYQIREFTLESGETPFRTWLATLAVAYRARIQARILRFESGNLGDHKSVGKGVWEARLDFGPGFRIYFGFEGSDVILLLAGGDKMSQRKDIKLAQTYWTGKVTHGATKP